MFGVYILGCCKVGGSAAALKLALANYQDDFFNSHPDLQTQHTFFLFSCLFFMRQLAAIMFVDMAGFTALMQENEQLVQRTTSLKTA
jgi:class 3 adenylate cyclase